MIDRRHLAVPDEQAGRRRRDAGIVEARQIHRPDGGQIEQQGVIFEPRVALGQGELVGGRFGAILSGAGEQAG